MLSFSSNIYKSFTRWFAPTHEWIDIQGSIGTIGITNFASHHFGEINFVNIHLNKNVKAGDEIGDIESVKTTNPVLSPMDGKIIEINPLIQENPKIINRSAERKGWLCKMQLSDPSNIGDLMDSQKYHDSIKV